MFKRERQLVRGGHKGEELIWGQSTGEGVKILGRFLLHRGMSAPSGRHPACTRLHLGPESVLLSDQVRDLEWGSICGQGLRTRAQPVTGDSVWVGNHDSICG